MCHTAGSIFWCNFCNLGLSVILKRHKQPNKYCLVRQMFLTWISVVPCKECNVCHMFVLHTVLFVCAVLEVKTCKNRIIFMVCPVVQIFINHLSFFLSSFTCLNLFISVFQDFFFLIADPQNEGSLPCGACSCSIRFLQFSHLSPGAAVCVPEVLAAADKHHLSYLWQHIQVYNKQQQQPLQLPWG